MKRVPPGSGEIVLVDAAPEPAALDEIGVLLSEYAAALGIDLGFQGFEEERHTLPGRYAPPEGALILARVGGEPAGCIALRPLAPGVGEVKRLYVRPAFRGRGLGRRLVERIIAEARSRGCRVLRLDTLPEMSAARRLYASFGWRPCGAYTHNPIPGAIFLELALEA